MNGNRTSDRRNCTFKTASIASFLLFAIVINCAFSLRVRIVEVFSGTTFRTSDGAIVRAISWSLNEGPFELVCDEPKASTIAKNKLLGQTILMWSRGIDPSGTELVSIQVNGIDYETLLNEGGACRRDNVPIAFTIPDAPKLVARSYDAKDETSTKAQSDPSARYNAAPNGQLPELYWQHAFNELYANGATEVAVEAGRADIVNDTYAIEVDKIQKWHEAIGQAMHYAKETGKKPAIALFNDGSSDADAAFAEAQKICASAGIKVWKINDYIPTGYSVRSPRNTTATIPASWLKSATPAAAPALNVGPRNGIYYINSSGKKEYVTDRYKQ